MMILPTRRGRHGVQMRRLSMGIGALGRGTESTLDGPWPFNPGNRDDVYSTRPAALQHGRAAFDGGACL